MRSPSPARRPLLAAAVMVSSAAGGCTAEPCSLPTRRLSLAMPPALHCDVSESEASLGGVFEPTDGGFALHTPDAEYEFSGPEPAIPNGTFVRAVYVCSPGLDAPGGKLLWLQNLPSLAGAVNPTEPGSRLWYSMAAGGALTLLPRVIPFHYGLELACNGTGPQAAVEIESLVIMDADPVALIEPGQTLSFKVPSGQHAGSYQGENVNITFQLDTAPQVPVTSPKDNPVDINFRITRAD